MLVAVAQAFGSSFAAFSKPLAEKWIRNGAGGTQTIRMVAHLGGKCSGQWVIHYATTPALILIL